MGSVHSQRRIKFNSKHSWDYVWSKNKFTGQCIFEELDYKSSFYDFTVFMEIVAPILCYMEIWVFLYVLTMCRNYEKHKNGASFQFDDFFSLGLLYLGFFYEMYFV